MFIAYNTHMIPISFKDFDLNIIGDYVDNNGYAIGSALVPAIGKEVKKLCEREEKEEEIDTDHHTLYIDQKNGIIILQEEPIEESPKKGPAKVYDFEKGKEKILKRKGKGDWEFKY